MWGRKEDTKIVLRVELVVCNRECNSRIMYIRRYVSWPLSYLEHAITNTLMVGGHNNGLFIHG